MAAAPIWKCALALALVMTRAAPGGSSVIAQPITFNKEIAPIVFQQCASCHRPDGAAPFPLLTYEDVRKRAQQIAEITRRRVMPPWLPEPGFGDFIGERRLSTNEIERIQTWVAQGAVEGAAADLPAMPRWPEGWRLGQPDLVLPMTPAYELAADGTDVYRNFIIRNPVAETSFVRAVEFHPNNRSVHHVRILLDSQGQSRRLDEEDPEPGFGGMRVPAKFPPGHLLTWVPGKVPAPEPDGLSWALEPDTDLVLQIHMQRTGKPELLQPALGLYFTNQPPTRSALVIGLVSQLIDVPPGEKDYVVERRFALPVDVEVLAVLPHLHYLGKEVQGFAVLPDGTKTWLLWIRRWDFNWQGEYRYRKPVFLSKGTVLTMRYSYDNSAENIHNPNHPPRRVAFGPQSTDEMAELWLQVLPRNGSELAILQRERRLMDSRETAAFYENFLRSYPNDAPSHVALGKLLGPLGQPALAGQHFQRALEINSSQVEAHYYLGLILFEQRRFPEARGEFEEELQLNPKFYKAHLGLGMIAIEEQNLTEAEADLRAALRINPKDSAVQQSLDRIIRARKGAAP